jgi:putative ATP-dependent endonuclease of the OLD family
VGPSPETNAFAMYIETLKINNFRCFGPDTQTISFDSPMNAFIGANGTGKTATMQALLRLFGVSGDQRRIRRHDFHVPSSEESQPQTRSFWIEVIIAFPELDSDSTENATSVPEFFNQMAANEDGELKCRFRLDATWTDDGSLDGSVDSHFRAITTLENDFSDEQAHPLSATDRIRIQMIYIPALRDPASQVTRFLKGRLWRAIRWSEELRSHVKEAAAEINEKFGKESAISAITRQISKRWREVHSGGTDAEPILRPVRERIEDLMQNVEVVFRPDEAGGDKDLDDLSDGQRSLFQIAMTAAILDIEEHASRDMNKAFTQDSIVLPELTLIALEEPENNLAPFYLARIMQQVKSLTTSRRAQAFVSSHSASILSRVDPEQVRFFNLNSSDRAVSVRAIQLPPTSEEAYKFVREAVRSYPELYFARFVILGEGPSEQVVLPILAEALGLQLDRSFVAIVPLGGRHVNHFWRLLTNLRIPFATLLDLDLGRYGGGASRIRTVVSELLAIGVTPSQILGSQDGTMNSLHEELDQMENTIESLKPWLSKLRRHGIYFSGPLDLDMLLLCKYHRCYTHLEEGMDGPDSQSDPYPAVLKGKSDQSLYPTEDWEDTFRWYRYLFLSRGKPSTHIRVVSQMTPNDIISGIPKQIKALLENAAKSIDQSLATEQNC